MKVNQRDVVFVHFHLPNGQFKPHPAVVISTNDLYEAEGIYYAVMLSTKQHNPDFMVTLVPNDFNYPTDTTSYAKCQLIIQLNDYDIIKRFGSIKAESLKLIIDKINEVVFGQG
ncbi:type II toxin-antitoxin system PemK/MazF family toxin [Runella aurantiaca]|uniref:Type II toxin-antitoxin system PemK/MazF family toxin n=1 Tax=Runella aurantiaca TaxID=2282308 RepID=A0A369I816_9BACT|nr:type II toxin-antitoxin system PemK/MazF family toxin [Runella aurantiaca]RDB04647.1 type II toxin-antitoxin system PemK/MazF family toxin [Runella aurantiaca]